MKSRLFTAVLATSLLIYGCGAIRVTPVETETNPAIEMVDDEDLGKVYLLPGFDFSKIDLLVVMDPSTRAVFEKKEIDPDAMAIHLKHGLVTRLSEARVFVKVTEDRSVLSSLKAFPGKVLVLETSFTELDPGSRALRWLAGLYGAGRTKVQIESEIRDPETKRLYFKASSRRIGMMGVFGGDSKDFILESLEGIAASHGAFVKRIAAGGKVGGQ